MHSEGTIRCCGTAVDVDVHAEVGRRQLGSTGGWGTLGGSCARRYYVCP